jgi:hypothetical protein
MQRPCWAVLAVWWWLVAAAAAVMVMQWCCSVLQGGCKQRPGPYFVCPYYSRGPCSLSQQTLLLC